MLVRSKNGGNFLLADVAADRKIDFSKLESLAKAKHFRFATRDEVISTTKCEPGSVHPLGSLFGIETFLDNSVLENGYVNFNIGMLTKSVKIRSEGSSSNNGTRFARRLFKAVNPFCIDEILRATLECLKRQRRFADSDNARNSQIRSWPRRRRRDGPHACRKLGVKNSPSQACCSGGRVCRACSQSCS